MKKMLLLAAALCLTAGALAQAPHKYGIKCGIVKTVTVNKYGTKSYNTTWFDDYGAKERSVTSMDSGNDIGTVEWVAIAPGDGKVYMLDDTHKIATATASGQINYLNMPEDVAKARKAKVIGEETVDGRKCVKWEEHIKQLLQTSTQITWVWQGIPIKYTIDKPKSETTLVELKQPKSIPASTFAIPDGYTVKELKK